MLPLGVPQVLVWGARDDQIPLSLAERYTQAATRAGDRVGLIVEPSAGHFESASPRSVMWPAVHSAIRSLLDGRLPD
jgi:pimeloyl-ACP methyl ester carboxylesterase